VLSEPRLAHQQDLRDAHEAYQQHIQSLFEHIRLSRQRLFGRRSEAHGGQQRLQFDEVEQTAEGATDEHDQALIWLPELGQLESSADILSTFDVDDMLTEALMFQAGYLTIAETHHRFGEYWCQLRYPSQEVYREQGLCRQIPGRRAAHSPDRRRIQPRAAECGGV
jgi:hypothetical protein